MQLKFSNILLEIMVEDKILREKVNEFAQLSDQIDRLKSHLKELSDKYNGIADELLPILEQASDSALQTKEHFIKIKKKGFERESYAYKECFVWLLERVSPQMKKIINEALEATKKISKIAPQIAVQKNESLNTIWQGFKGWLKQLTSKLKRYIDDIDEANKQFDKRLSKIK